MAERSSDDTATEDPAATEDTAAAVREADRRNGEPGATDTTPPGAPRHPPPGRDTPTGTDPDAKYERPGYEDKSFGQAVGQDQELADRLLDEAGGDEATAEERFRQGAAGSPAADRQRGRGAGTGAGQDPASPGGAIGRDEAPPEPNEPA